MIRGYPAPLKPEEEFKIGDIVALLGAIVPGATASELHFPYDFGFVPSTLVDVLLLLDASVPVGCVLSARLIGVIEAKQREDGQRWVRNDRLLAVVSARSATSNRS